MRTLRYEDSIAKSKEVQIDLVFINTCRRCLFPRYPAPWLPPEASIVCLMAACSIPAKGRFAKNFPMEPRDRVFLDSPGLSSASNSPKRKPKSTRCNRSQDALDAFARAAAFSSSRAFPGQSPPVGNSYTPGSKFTDCYISSPSDNLMIRTRTSPTYPLFDL